MEKKLYKHNRKFQLESGKEITGLQLSYKTYGNLNDSGDNVIWITHALTGDQNPDKWWTGLVGEEKLYDPTTHFIVCMNVLGSCYGTTGPLSINEDTGNPYYHDFPLFSVVDIVNTLEILRTHLGINKIHTLVGGSLGGQQAIEWAIQNPCLVENLFLVATNAQHSPWGIAFNESQRLAIKADRTWFSYSKDAGLKGLKAARSLALLSYRSYETYHVNQKDYDNRVNDFKSSSYQNYQGAKLVNRFNAFSYWYLTKAMDSHNVGRNRGGVLRALKKVRANTLVVAIDSDNLFPVCESRLLKKGIEGSELAIISSLYGHDGFLIETEKLKSEFQRFYDRINGKNEIKRPLKIAI